MSDPVIRLEGLAKSHGSVAALRGLDLAVPAGTIFGLLGPNGAGKSATLRLLAGLLTPTAGQAWLLGFSVRTQVDALRSIVGVVPDDLALFDRLTVWEHLDLARALYRIPEADFRRRSEELLELFGLREAANRPAIQCSYGMRKKTALALALLPNPRLLLLDEPFEGLDPLMCVTLQQALRRAAAQGLIVFLTTHMLATADGLLDRYAILRAGELVEAGETAALAARRIHLAAGSLSGSNMPLDLALEAAMLTALVPVLFLLAARNLFPLASLALDLALLALVTVLYLRLLRRSHWPES